MNTNSPISTQTLMPTTPLQSRLNLLLRIGRLLGSANDASYESLCLLLDVGGWKLESEMSAPIYAECLDELRHVAHNSEKISLRTKSTILQFLESRDNQCLPRKSPDPIADKSKQQTEKETTFPSSHNCPIPDATIATHVRRFTELLDLEWKNALVQEKVVIQENVQIQWRPIDKTNRTEALFTLENNETEISVNDVLDIKHCLSGWRNHGFVRSVDGKTIHLKMAKNFKKTDQTSGFAILLGLNIGLFARMKEALSNFANNDMHETIRKMIAGNVDQTANVIQIDPNLVQNQTPPVAYALGHRLTLIQGSNLTAKCETVLKIVFQLIKTECKDKRAPKILVCSPSDVALDSMAIKISQLGCDVVRVYHPALESKSLPASHLGLHNLVRENRNQQNENRYDKYIRSKQNVGETIEDLEKRKSVVLIDLKKKVLNASRVFCMTCYDAGMELLKQMPHLKFNTVLIDEACQTSELETLIAAAKASQRLILIGGQMQASPRGSNLDDDFFDLSTSLFERLVKSGVKPQLLEMNQ